MKSIDLQIDMRRLVAQHLKQPSNCAEDNRSRTGTEPSEADPGDEQPEVADNCDNENLVRSDN